MATRSAWLFENSVVTPSFPRRVSATTAIGTSLAMGAAADVATAVHGFPVAVILAGSAVGAVRPAAVETALGGAGALGTVMATVAAGGGAASAAGAGIRGIGLGHVLSGGAVRRDGSG